MISCLRALIDVKESVKIIVGGFKHVLYDLIPNYEQYVKCSTRAEHTLDNLYCDAKDSYRVIKKLPLGKAGHNMLLCPPKYEQLLKREKCTKNPSVGLERRSCF